jgi:hypothetical protein
MSVQINISGTTIEFPSSAQSPNWAPALIEFAQTVEGALSGVVGTYDVPPQVISLVNNGVKTDITALSFPTNLVRSVTVRYGFYRQIETSPAVFSKQYETGTLLLVSDSSGWVLQREFIGNTTPIENPAGTISSGLMFYINSSGQVSYDASILSGIGGTYQGSLTFAAQALAQT